MSICPLCGRPKDPQDKFCDYCSSMLCEVCGERLARGYCAICGRLVCEKDSKMIGFARVCLDCLRTRPEISDYDDLKRYIKLTRNALIKKPVRKISRIYDIDGELELIDRLFLHVGIDDTDSPYGMCTTYLGAILYSKLIKYGKPMDYPLLIRLNPNIPIKTRGNGAVALRFLIHRKNLNAIKQLIINAIEKKSHVFFRKTRPAVAIYLTNDYIIDKVLYDIYLNSLNDITPLNYLKRKLFELKNGRLEIYAYDNESRGIIGSVAAIGAILDDYTYELLAYRRRENISKPRRIDKGSVIEMNKKFHSFTFDNIDGERLLIAPVGPDPVLFGIRGDYPEKLIEAINVIKHEEIELWAIFRTNQGTHSHVIRISDPAKARPYQTIMINGKILDVRKEGDKVLMHLINEDWLIIGRVFKIQRELQRIAMKLRTNDELILIGSVYERNNNLLTINVEEFIAMGLVPEIEYRNPLCPYCGSRLKKKDKNTYICRKCRKSFKYDKKLIVLRQRSDIFERKRYNSPPRAHRHLTLPTKRLFIRARKISGLEEPYMVHPIVGREKKVKAKILGKIIKIGIA